MPCTISIRQWIEPDLTDSADERPTRTKLRHAADSLLSMVRTREPLVWMHQNFDAVTGTYSLQTGLPWPPGRFRRRFFPEPDAWTDAMLIVLPSTCFW